MKRLLLLFLCLPFWVGAQDCLPGWDYYRDLIVTNPPFNEDLTDFQVRVSFKTGSLVDEGKLKPGGEDLRILGPNCTPLPFYVDSVFSNTDNMLWIRVPSLPAGESVVLRAYYGNPDAAQAVMDPDATFEFFDDFEDGELDPDKWEAVGEYGTLEVADGVLDYASTGDAQNSRFKFVRSKVAFDSLVNIQFRIDMNNNATFGLASRDSLLERYFFRYGSGASDTLALVAFAKDTFTNGFASVVDYPWISIPKFEWNEVGLSARINEASKIEVLRFGNLSTDELNNTLFELPNLEMEGFRFLLTSFAEIFHVYLDYIRVTKGVDGLLPSVIEGEEEMNMASFVREVSADAALQVYPNPVAGEAVLQGAFEGGLYIRLFDARGKQVAAFTTVASGGKAVVDLGSVSAGTYFLQAIDEEGRIFSGSGALLKR